MQWFGRPKGGKENEKANFDHILAKWIYKEWCKSRAKEMTELRKVFLLNGMKHDFMMGEAMKGKER